MRGAPLDGSVVVVTGATSGVGRAAALAFAGEGAYVVAVARDIAQVAAVAEACRSLAGLALAAAADMADPEAGERVRREAVERFGRIDVWVNAAAVGIAGHFGDEPVEEVQRLVDTNVMGYVLGSRAALAQFNAQGGGTLINVASLLGLVPNPLVPTYVMTKFAIRGLTLSLHQDFGRRRGIQVCSVLPGPVDTSFFDRAANHTGHRLRAIPPAASPERVAAKILSCARRPRREVTVGIVPHLIHLGHRFAPALVEWLVARASAALLLRRSEPVADNSGALFQSTATSAPGGGWRRNPARRHLGDALGRMLSRWA